MSGRAPYPAASGILKDRYSVNVAVGHKDFVALGNDCQAAFIHTVQADDLCVFDLRRDRQVSCSPLHHGDGDPVLVEIRKRGHVAEIFGLRVSWSKPISKPQIGIESFTASATLWLAVQGSGDIPFPCP